MTTCAWGTDQGIGWKAAAWALTFALFAAASLAGQVSREYDVKAAFLLNFATFVEWPPEVFAHADSPFVIGVMGNDPFGRTLDEMVSGERVKERPLVVYRLDRLEDMHRCHILFISASEAKRVKAILRRLQGQPVLTVADLPGFTEQGGGIGFTTATRVALVINPVVLRAAGLRISSKLLRLAQVIQEGATAP